MNNFMFYSPTRFIFGKGEEMMWGTIFPNTVPAR